MKIDQIATVFSSVQSVRRKGNYCNNQRRRQGRFVFWVSLALFRDFQNVPFLAPLASGGSSERTIIFVKCMCDINADRK